MGQPELNLCHIIKRQPLKQSAVNKLKFKAPSEPGQHELKLMFISDSYVGADQVGCTDDTSSAGTTQQLVVYCWLPCGASHLAFSEDSIQQHVPACLQEYELNLTVEPSTNIDEEEAEPMES